MAISHSIYTHRHAAERTYSVNHHLNSLSGGSKHICTNNSPVYHLQKILKLDSCIIVPCNFGNAKFGSHSNIDHTHMNSLLGVTPRHNTRPVHPLTCVGEHRHAPVNACECRHTQVNVRMWACAGERRHAREAVKPGLDWTMDSGLDWTMDWTLDWTELESATFCYIETEK